MFSRRSHFELNPNRLAIALKEAHASGRHVLDLTVSNPTTAGVPYDSTIVESLASPGSLRYEPEPFGLMRAREAVARELSLLGPHVDPERLVLTASTSEAYAFLFKLLADAGDEVLVPRPSYPLFEHLAKVECVRCVPYRLEYDGTWHIDLASIESALTPRTRAIVTVAPNNPTGSYLRRDELRALVGTGLPIVSDEVFSQYPLREDHEGGRVVSALEAQGAPLVFALGGLSKLAALPQMKLGWIAADGDRELVARAFSRLEVVADAFLSVGTPVQHAAEILLQTRRLAEAAIRRRTRANVDAARKAVEGSAISVLDVEGGWYATLRLPATRSEEDWALAFLEHNGVHVHPGHFFDFESEAFVVVSLLTPEAAFHEGMARIVSFVNAACT